jgi:MerR family transcriptional regulator, copper efflux regulator
MRFSLVLFTEVLFTERAVVAGTGHTLREHGRSPHVSSGFLDEKLLRLVIVRISEAARRLGTSPRMLRYREDLGLLPRVRDRLPGPMRRPSRVSGRQFAAASEASARQFGASARQLGASARQLGASHRQFDEADLEAVAAALELERRYDISPASLAFGLRVVAEPAVRAAVADLGRRLGRVPPAPSRALDFEKERALRALSRG